MKPLTTRGRLFPLLLFLAILAVIVSTLVGVAQGTNATTLLGAEPQPGSFTVSASALGDFSATAPAIKSPSAIVINSTTGKILYSRNANVVRPMASTTKIMTGILILEKLELDTKVVISANAANTMEPVSWLREGDVLTVEDLLYALFLRSANSAAVALAEACSGSVEAFAGEMNKKAASLGMDRTNFVNPNGLDKSGHHSTAADMAVLARYAMQNAKFREFVSTEKHSIPLPGRGTLVCENTNKLLGKVDWVTGIKTGLTPKAEQCYVGSGTKDGVNVVSVVLGQPVPNVCFSESKALMLYGFSQYRYVSLMEKGVVVAEAEVPYRLDGRVQLLTADSVGMELYKEDSVTTSVVLEKPLSLPVAAGDVFGKVTLTVDGEVVGTVDLVAAQSYGKTSLGSKVAYFWHRLGRWIGKVF